MADKLVIKRLVVGPLAANCFFFGSNDSGMVIDPGGNAGAIRRAVIEAGLTVKIIALTHGHSDHIAALRDIQDITGAEVVIHREDADFLATSSQFGISYRTPPHRTAS
jgi:glyoxylase-like metal-dependent hydrolase (beta-lactamase superfamily II)